MSVDRLVGIGAVALGIVLYTLAGESEAYLFPRIIALTIGLLGLAMTGTTIVAARATAVDSAAPTHGWGKVLPAIAILLGYRWALELVGFYTAAFAAFMVIIWLYAPERASMRGAAKRIAISAAFVGVLFAIFAVLLRVQTPRGFLI